MISKDILTQSTAILPAEKRTQEPAKAGRRNIGNMPYIPWICLLMACIGASWFTYQYFLVPQPKSFAPDWHGAQWIRASDGGATTAYFRYESELKVVPDNAFVTIAATQVFT